VIWFGTNDAAINTESHASDEALIDVALTSFERNIGGLISMGGG
jgi:hypothetical protein